MSLHELPPPSCEAETFEAYWQKRCARSEFLREYSEGPPLNREQWLEIIDEQYQDVLCENCSEEKRRKKLVFLEALRKSFAARMA